MDTIKNLIIHYKSKSGSSYSFTAEGVYRISNHWGRTADCRWRLDSLENYKNQQTKAGFAKWTDFYSNTDSGKLYFITVDFDKKTATFFHKDSPLYNGTVTLRTASETSKIIRQIKEILNKTSWADYCLYQDMEELRKEVVTKLITTAKSFLEIKREIGLEYYNVKTKNQKNFILDR